MLDWSSTDVGQYLDEIMGRGELAKAAIPRDLVPEVPRRPVAGRRQVIGGLGLRLLVGKPLIKSLLAKEPAEDKMRRILQSHVDEAKTDDERKRARKALLEFKRVDRDAG